MSQETLCDPGWYVHKTDVQNKLCVAGGCSEGLGAFRFFFKHTQHDYITISIVLIPQSPYTYFHKFISDPNGLL